MILTTAQIKALYALKDADVAFEMEQRGALALDVWTAKADRRWLINEEGATVKLLPKEEM